LPPPLTRQTRESPPQPAPPKAHARLSSTGSPTTPHDDLLDPQTPGVNAIPRLAMAEGGNGGGGSGSSSQLPQNNARARTGNRGELFLTKEKPKPLPKYVHTTLYGVF
jgi:hypothetical protein